jgi:hypothetical protein
MATTPLRLVAGLQYRDNRRQTEQCMTRAPCVRLVEVSAVTFPAYTATTATVHPPGRPRRRSAGRDYSNLPPAVAARLRQIDITAWCVERGL